MICAGCNKDRNCSQDWDGKTWLCNECEGDQVGLRGKEGRKFCPQHGERDQVGIYCSQPMGTRLTCGEPLQNENEACRCWNEGQWGRVHREDCPVHGPEKVDQRQVTIEELDRLVSSFCKAIGEPVPVEAIKKVTNARRATILLVSVIETIQPSNGIWEDEKTWMVYAAAREMLGIPVEEGPIT